jgi:hypothetical protein
LFVRNFVCYRGLRLVLSFWPATLLIVSWRQNQIFGKKILPGFAADSCRRLILLLSMLMKRKRRGWRFFFQNLPDLVLHGRIQYAVLKNGSLKMAEE